MKKNPASLILLLIFSFLLFSSSRIFAGSDAAPGSEEIINYFKQIDNEARNLNYEKAFELIESLKENPVFWGAVNNLKDESVEFENYEELKFYYLVKSQNFSDAIKFIKDECNEILKYPLLNLETWRLRLQITEDKDNEFENVKSEFEEAAMLIAVAKDMNDDEKYYKFLIRGYYLIRDKETSNKFKYEYLEKHPETKYAIDLTREDYFSISVERDDKKRLEMCDEFLETHNITYFNEKVIATKLYTLRFLKKNRRFKQEVELLMSIEEFQNSPYILNAIAYNYLEMKGNKKRALEYSKKAVEIIDKGWELDFYDHLYTEDVWKKMKDEMKSSVYFNYARVLIEMKEFKAAETYIKKAQDLAHRGVDDEDTLAQFDYLFGLNNEKQKRGFDKSRYRFAIYAGDTRDRWTQKSEERLGNLLKKKYGDGVFPFKKKLTREKIYSKTLYDKGINRSTNIQFKDLTKISAFKDVKAGRIAIGDFNNDGLDDILLNGVRLFKNKGNFEFEEVTDEVGLAGNPSNGGIWCDFNLDGLLDIYTISHKENGDKLWIQVEPGKFVDKTEEFGNITDRYPSEGCAVSDFNGDGWPDIYVANYEKKRESEFDSYAIGTPDKLYLNEEGKGFREASIELGMIPPYGEELCGRGVSPCDFDDDGIQEIYVSNYRLDENLLWDFKDGKFVNIADDLKINGDEVDGYYGHTIGSVWGDIDNDGDFDLFCANLAHPRYIKFSDKSMVYLNEKGNFTDKRAEFGIKFEETHSDPMLADLNESGELDIYITSIYSNRRSFLYRDFFGNKIDTEEGREKRPSFDETYFSGVRVYNGWGCAASDFDNDGDLDLFVCSNSGVHIFQNQSNNKNFIQIKFIRGDKPQICEAGIRVYLKPGEIPYYCDYLRSGCPQMREVFLGRGTTSQDSTTIHFGIGYQTEFDVILQLPVSRKEIKVSNVKPGTILYFNLTTLSFTPQ